jgi:DNA adenine methylase
MGSKSRIAKHILPIILKDRKEGQWYVEPFVGGANMIDKVEGNRIGSDLNSWVIDALSAIQNELHKLPKNNTEFTELDYQKLRKGTYRFKGYAGFAFSYTGKWLDGWCRDYLNKRDYVSEAYKNALKQNPNIQGIVFVKAGYDSLIIPDKSIIYLDPPYAGATKYKDDFDHDKLWVWCREMKKLGHTIFVSEYKAPDDFICIWEMEINSSLTKNTGGKKAIEKLFTL